MILVDRSDLDNCYMGTAVSIVSMLSDGAGISILEPVIQPATTLAIILECSSPEVSIRSISLTTETHLDRKHEESLVLPPLYDLTLPPNYLEL